MLARQRGRPSVARRTRARDVRHRRALVLSQVFLSFGIPFALVPLVIFTRDREIMGALVTRRLTNVAAIAVTAVIVGLNVYLLSTS